MIFAIIRVVNLLRLQVYSTCINKHNTPHAISLYVQTGDFAKGKSGINRKRADIAQQASRVTKIAITLKEYVDDWPLSFVRLTSLVITWRDFQGIGMIRFSIKGIINEILSIEFNAIRKGEMQSSSNGPKRENDDNWAMNG